MDGDNERITSTPSTRGRGISRTRAIIHVNRAFIAANRINGNDKLPVYTMKRNGKTIYGHAMIIHGRSVMIDPRDHKPLPCGARAWIETHGKVTVINPMTWAQVKEVRDQS